MGLVFLAGNHTSVFHLAREFVRIAPAGFYPVGIRQLCVNTAGFVITLTSQDSNIL